MNHLLFLLIGCLFHPLLFSQNTQTKVFFDKNGKATTEAMAFYYRQAPKSGNLYKANYTGNGSIYYEGKILKVDPADESLNLYTGTFTWYYKNGQKKAIRNFNALGEEDGKSVWYYESGKIWKEVEYSKGKKSGSRVKEYNEDGQASTIFEEDFNNNSNDWDLYESDKNSAAIENGSLTITSYTNFGASRYISVSSEQSPEFSLEAVIQTDKLKKGNKAGLIYGFKDWQNYNFFLISQSNFSVGTVYEGVKDIDADGMYSGSISDKAPNTIKILGGRDKNYYSINGEVHFTSDRTRNFGSNIGIAVSGKASVVADKLIFKEISFNASSSASSAADLNVKATGSGLIITASGHIITNHHVVGKSENIVVEKITNGITKNYNATVLNKDVDNDLAILKISDPAFSLLAAPLPYSLIEGGLDVGAMVFTIGYPHALSGMGKEAKFTDGKISSKTGYNNSLNSYQTSIPVQPGNSGGPLFSDKGELVGVINAKFSGGDNVSYAIKLNYIKNLVDVLPEKIALPSDKHIAGLTLEEKIKVLTNYVVLIKTK